MIELCVIGSPSELQLFFCGTLDECRQELETYPEVYEQLREMFIDFGVYTENDFCDTISRFFGGDE